MPSTLKKFAIRLAIILMLFFGNFTTTCQAAFPISQKTVLAMPQEGAHPEFKAQQKINLPQNPEIGNEKNTVRSPIFGVLSIFCILSIPLFPNTIIIASILAVIFGIIGVQKGRKPNFLAVLGLSLGVIALLLILFGIIVFI